MNLKKPLTLDEQLMKLKYHGLIVSDDKAAKELLSHTGYYRLTGYGLQFRESATSSAFRKGTTLEQIADTYFFDELLRALLRVYLERIEIYTRANIATGFSLIKCMDAPYDAHYYDTNFYNKSGYAFIMQSLEREERHSQDSLFVRHHKQHYEGRMPLWVVTELISFSNLSKLYSAMYISEQNEIARMMHTKPITLRNHLHCLSTLRNKCAHGARLYNNAFSFPAKLGTKYLQKHPYVKADSLFAYTIVILRRLPTRDYRESFIDELVHLLENYKNKIDIELMGFPAVYLKLLEQEL